MFQSERISVKEIETSKIHIHQPWYSDKFDEHKFNIRSDLSGSEIGPFKRWVKSLKWEGVKRQWNPDFDEWSCDLQNLPLVYTHLSTKYRVTMSEKLWRTYQEVYQEFVDEADYIGKSDEEIGTVTTGF